MQFELLYSPMGTGDYQDMVPAYLGIATIGTYVLFSVMSAGNAVMSIAEEDAEIEANLTNMLTISGMRMVVNVGKELFINLIVIFTYGVGVTCMFYYLAWFIAVPFSMYFLI